MGRQPEGAPQPVLSSGRLHLRPLAPQDAEGLLALFGDPQVVRYYDLPLFRSREDGLALVVESIEGSRSGESMRWAVLQGDGAGDFVGCVSLHGVHPRHRYGELGFAIQRARWGEGLGTEAVGLVAQAAFDTLGLNRLEAFVDPRNGSSAALLQGLGFTCEGRLRGRFWDGTSFQDDILYSRLRPSESG